MVIFVAFLLIVMMKKLYILLTGLLMSLSCPVFAQMTDEQVVEYVKTSVSSGKTESQISRELLARGVTRAQAERIKANYKDQIEGAGGSVSSRAASGSTIKRESEASARDLWDLDMRDGGEEGANSNDGLSGIIKGEGKIPVFGHDVFGKKSTISFEPNENLATPDSYILGPGDEILIEVWGISEARISSVISPEGRISISQVGPIQLSGLTIKEATRKIKGKLAGKYAGVGGKDADISVTLGNIRTIQVNVLGQVNAPGTYRLSSFSTVFNALYRAGGVDANGSLRQVRLVRGGKDIATIDIYEFLFSGRRTNDISLQEGDVVMVPPYAELVTVEGDVKRAMKYELLEGETLEKLIEYAGGFASAAYRDDVKIVRSTGHEKEMLTVRNSDFASCVLQDGDVVTVGSNLDRFANRVEIRGYVFRPGEFQMGGDIATVRQLVNAAGGLTEDAFRGRAVLLREKADLSLETVPVNVGAILDGSAEDVLLRKNDVLVVSGIFELEDRGVLTINGMVMKPGEFPFSDNTTVEDLILQAGGLLDGASTVRVDVARRIYDPAAMTWSDSLAIAYTCAIKDGLSVGDEGNFVLEPYDVVSVRRSPGFRPQKFVEIQGNVAFPGQYVLLNEGERISSLIERAGGFAGNANPRGAVLLRKRNGSMDERMLGESLDKLSRLSSTDTLSVALSGEYRVALNLGYAMNHRGGSADLILQEGDVVNIPELMNTVQVSGEVMSPNALVYMPGKPVSYYISAAGGYTDRAKKSRTYVIYQNGSASRNILNGAKVEPGCTIVVPTKPERKATTTTDVIATANMATSLTYVLAMLLNLF